LKILENNIVKLRALEPSDIDLLYKWENDTSIWQVSNSFVPFSRYILQKYIENSHQDIYQAKQLRLMIDIKTDDPDRSKTIGSIDLFDFDPFHKRAGVGILIGDKKNRNKGYASAALDVLINYAFNILNLHQLYCNINADNENSLQLFKKHGFEIVGVKKDWIKCFDGWIGEYLLQLINTA